jgi:hypothetical protein
MDDLKKRLRAKTKSGPPSWIDTPINPDGAEAADRIEALEAKLHHYKHEVVETALANENDALSSLDKIVQERDEALNQLDSARHSVEVLKRRVQKIREEALREALDAAREYRYRRGEAVENAILALIEKDKTNG